MKRTHSCVFLEEYPHNHQFDLIYSQSFIIITNYTSLAARWLRYNGTRKQTQCDLSNYVDLKLFNRNICFYYSNSRNHGIMESFYTRTILITVLSAIFRRSMGRSSLPSTADCLFNPKIPYYSYLTSHKLSCTIYWIIGTYFDREILKSSQLCLKNIISEFYISGIVAQLKRNIFITSN